MTNKSPQHILTTHRNWALFLFSFVILLFFNPANLGILRTLLVIAAVIIGIAHIILFKRNPADVPSQLKLKQGLVLILVVTLASATSSVFKTLTAPAEAVKPIATAQPHKQLPSVPKAASSTVSSSSSTDAASSQVTTAIAPTPPASSSSVIANNDPDTDTAAADTAASQTPATQASASSASQDMSDRVATNSGGIIADVNSHIYHLPGQKKYHIKPENIVRFATEADAQAAGYIRSKR